MPLCVISVISMKIINSTNRMSIILKTFMDAFKILNEDKKNLIFGLSFVFICVLFAYAVNT